MEITLRSVEELQEAHDLMHAVITEEIPARFRDPGIKIAIHAYLDVLCWVLHHDENTSFAENLERLRQTIHDAGYRATDVPPSTIH